MLTGVGDAVDILCRLRRAGALLIDGESRPPQEAAPRSRPSTQSDQSAPFATSDLGPLSAEEKAALEQSVDLDDGARRRIIAARRKLQNYFELLEVEPDVGRRQLKRAYFRFSKHFHPDRYYGQELGVFGDWLSEIFEAATRGFNVLSDSRQRKAYEARLLGRKGGPGSQTREEHAAELFERACDTEIRGDLEQALQLFSAACRTHPKPSYISRAARCALRAAKMNRTGAPDGSRLSLAEEYAKKAAGLRPKDPSYARLLADVYRAAGRFEDAEATLLHAIDLNSENDVLMAELRQDLEKVRRDRPSGGGQRSLR